MYIACTRASSGRRPSSTGSMRRSQAQTLPPTTPSRSPIHAEQLAGRDQLGVRGDRRVARRHARFERQAVLADAQRDPVLGEHGDVGFRRASDPHAIGFDAHAHLPMQKRAKTPSRTASVAAAPVISPSAATAASSSGATRSSGSPAASVARACASASRARATASACRADARCGRARSSVSPCQPAARDRAREPRRASPRRTPSPTARRVRRRRARRSRALPRSRLLNSTTRRATARPLEHGARVGVERARTVDDDQRDGGAVERAPRAFDAAALDRVVAGAQPGRVEHAHRDAVDAERLLDHVARRPGSRRDDRALFAEQRVEQRRLPGVRRADDRQRQTLAHAAARAPSRRSAREPRVDAVDARGTRSRAGSGTSSG